MPHRISVLFVDDDPNVVQLLDRAATALFEQAHFCVIHTYDKAITYLDALQGVGPRLVLLGISRQTEQAGLDFLAQLRKHPQGRLMPIIMLSADHDPRRVRQAYEQGVSVYTRKPFSCADWQAYLQRLKAYWFDVATLPTLWFDA